MHLQLPLTTLGSPDRKNQRLNIEYTSYSESSASSAILYWESSELTLEPWNLFL